MNTKLMDGCGVMLVSLHYDWAGLPHFRTTDSCMYVCLAGETRVQMEAADSDKSGRVRDGSKARRST